MPLDCSRREPSVVPPGLRVKTPARILGATLFMALSAAPIAAYATEGGEPPPEVPEGSFSTESPGAKTEFTQPEPAAEPVAPAPAPSNEQPPAEPAPAQSESGEPPPVDSAPVEPPPVAPEPTEPQTVESQTVERHPKRTEVVAAQTEPEPAPSSAAPAHPTPTPTPTASSPVASSPVASSPVDRDPSTGHPRSAAADLDVPTQPKPTTLDVAGSRSGPSEPTAEAPSAAKVTPQSSVAFKESAPVVATGDEAMRAAGHDPVGEQPQDGRYEDAEATTPMEPTAPLEPMASRDSKPATAGAIDASSTDGPGHTVRGDADNSGAWVEADQAAVFDKVLGASGAHGRDRLPEHTGEQPRAGREGDTADVPAVAAPQPTVAAREHADGGGTSATLREADASDGLAVMAPWWARHNDEPTPEWAAPGSTALVSERPDPAEDGQEPQDRQEPRDRITSGRGPGTGDDPDAGGRKGARDDAGSGTKESLERNTDGEDRGARSAGSTTRERSRESFQTQESGEMPAPDSAPESPLLALVERLFGSGDRSGRATSPDPDRGRDQGPERGDAGPGNKDASEDDAEQTDGSARRAERDESESRRGNDDGGSRPARPQPARTDTPTRGADDRRSDRQRAPEPSRSGSEPNDEPRTRTDSDTPGNEGGTATPDRGNSGKNNSGKNADADVRADGPASGVADSTAESWAVGDAGRHGLTLQPIQALDLLSRMLEGPSGLLRQAHAQAHQQQQAQQQQNDGPDRSPAEAPTAQAPAANSQTRTREDRTAAPTTPASIDSAGPEARAASPRDAEIVAGAGERRGMVPVRPVLLRQAQVAGPNRPAPAAPQARLAPPSGPGAATAAAYPDVPQRARTTWSSGVHLADVDEAAVRRAARLARETGRAFDVVAARLPAGTWSDIERPTQALSALAQVPGRKVLSVSLLPDAGGSLAACEKGRYHGYWRGFAGEVAKHGLAKAIIDLRPDAAGVAEADPAGHAACYRRVVASLRSQLPQVQTQWTVPRGARPGQDPRLAWPGAGVVSVVGVDALDSGDDWGRAINGEFGLNWWADFARQQGRRVALAQWGPFPGSAASAANAPYIQNMHDWFVRAQARKELAYEAFTAPEQELGSAVAAYRELFLR